MAAMDSLRAILRSAAEADASDVHLSVGAAPRMRVQGQLAEMGYPKLQPGDTLDMLVNIMNDIQRERFEERGEYEMSFAVSEQIRCRVSAYKQKGSVSLSIRLIPARVPSLEMIGASQALVQTTRLRNGLVIVTGPMGSGKTTTLAAMVDGINKSRASHIITLENPIEYVHSHNRSIVDQREIGSDSGSCAAALNAVLKADPDVVMVDRLYGSDAVRAALQAAEAGCLVLASVAAIGANGALDALLNDFTSLERQQIRGRLAGVLQSVAVQKRAFGADGRLSISCEVMRVEQQTRNAIRGLPSS